MNITGLFKLEPEQTQVRKVVDNHWPKEGNVQFKNVVYRYGKEMEPALRGVTFNVKKCEKVGIVGRTGVIIFFLIKKYTEKN